MPRRFRFDRFELNERTGTLLDRGVPLQVQPKVFELLQLLLEQPGTLLSREELHERLWPGVFVTDSSINQVIRRLRSSLGEADVLRTVPRRGYQLVAPVEVLEEEAPEPGPSPLLPARSALVGRDAALDALAAALDRHELVWLHGAPGVGRTEVARLAAAESGLPVLQLRPLAGPGSAQRELALALALPLDGSEAAAGRALAERGALDGLLVVVDDLHLDPSGRGWLERRRRDAPRVRWLATTVDRAQCGTDLAVTGPVVALEGLPHAEAVALLANRSGVPLDGADPAVIELVQRLDGNPLAIVLAAPRLRLLRPVELLQRLVRRFELLRSPGKSLLASLDGAWEALDEPAREALLRLAAIGAGVPLAAAEELLGGPAGTDALQGLVDTGWLRLRPGDGGTWLEVPHNQRAWALERLPPDLGQQALQAVAAWLEREGLPRAEAFTSGHDRSQRTWLAEHADLCEQIASGWSGAPRPPLLELLGVAVGIRGGPFESTLQQFERTLQAGGIAREERARLRIRLGQLQVRRGRFAAATSALELASQEACGLDPKLEAWALSTLAVQLVYDTRAPEAADVARRAVTLAEGTGSPTVLADALYALFAADRATGTPDLGILDRALALSTPAGAPVRRMIQSTLALALHEEGRIATAEALYREWMAEDRWSLDSHRVQVWSNLGDLLLGTQRFEEALERFECALALARQRGIELNISLLQARRARTLVALGRTEEAEALLRQALGSSPTTDENRLYFHLVLGLAALRANEPARTVLRLEEGLRLGIEHGLTLAFGAIARVHQGDLAGAERWLERAKATGESHFEHQAATQLATAWVLHARGETASCEALLASFDRAPYPHVAPLALGLAEMSWLRPPSEAGVALRVVS